MILGRLTQLPTLQPVHRLVVLVLVACSFACCCQQRAIGGLLGLGEAPRADACCESCHAEDEPSDDTPREQRHPEGRCLNACCTKADFKNPPFTVACDQIGEPRADVVVPRDMLRAAHAMRAPRVEDDVGEPPPWLLLLASARLRI